MSKAKFKCKHCGGDKLVKSHSGGYVCQVCGHEAENVFKDNILSNRWEQAISS